MRRHLPLVGGVLGALIGAVVVAGIVTFFVLSKTYRLPTEAMEPDLKVGDRVAVLRFVGPVKPDRGDLVAFESPPRMEVECGLPGTYIHRIVAIPGETWWIERGVVYVNGAELDEPYLPGARRGSVTEPRRTVPAGHYAVLGDNREVACDSRYWGHVTPGHLIGEVVAVYWPPSRWGFR